MLDDLYQVLLERKEQAPAGSYTAKLLAGGQEMILRKIHEETFELVQAANMETDQRLVEESADLLYHWLVLLTARDIPLDSIWQELKKRRPSGNGEANAG